jgi:hypothetical protein
VNGGTALAAAIAATFLAALIYGVSTCSVF